MIDQTRLVLFDLINDIVKGMLGKFLFFILIMSLALLSLLLTMTTPGTAGATGVLGVFVLAYLALLSSLTFFMYGVSRIIVRFSKTVTMRKPLQPMSMKL